MKTYTVRELQNLQSHREGTEIAAKTLADAKRLATRNQVFQGTVLVIEEGGHRVAYKENGRWTNCE